MKQLNKKIIQITSGKGPAECEYFVGEVFEILKNEMISEKIDFRILDSEEGIEEGFQSITFEISESSEAYLDQREKNENFIENWLGSIQIISKSKLRPNHKRKNWFIGIFEIENFQELKLNEKEIEFQTMRSSGNGGQNVNKVNSAVRAIHQPTKIQVVAMDSRSQLENKKIAIERLKLKILEKNAKEKYLQKENQWMNHLQLERGNPVKIFKF